MLDRPNWIIFLYLATGNSHTELNIVMCACMCALKQSQREKNLLGTRISIITVISIIIKESETLILYIHLKLFTLWLWHSVVAVVGLFCFLLSARPVSHCVCVYLCCSCVRRFFALYLFHSLKCVVFVWTTIQFGWCVSCSHIYTNASFSYTNTHTQTPTGSTLLYDFLDDVNHVMHTKISKSMLGNVFVCVCITYAHMFLW